MVIIPVALTNLLGEVDESTGNELALRFAEHVTEALGDSVRPQVQEYLIESRRVLATGDGLKALRAMQATVRQLSWDSQSHAESVIIALAITATFCALQRQMEEAGLKSREGYQSSALEVAKDAQAAVKRLASESGEGNSSFLAYEEARWQLVRVLPNPRSID